MNPEIVFSLLMGVNLGVTFMNLPPALDHLMAVYKVSYTHISVLISALFWSHALMQLPGGMITDRIGIRRTLFMSLGFISLGSILPVLLPGLQLAICGRVITGVGTGLGFASTMKLVALYAPNGRIGAYQSFYAGFFSFGNIVAYLAIPSLIQFGWRWTYLAPAGISLSLLAMSATLCLKPLTSAVNQPLPVRQIIRIKAGWVLGAYHALSWGTTVSLGNWVPSILAEVWSDSSAMHLAWGGALATLASGLGRLSGGILLLKFSPLIIANGSIFILSMSFLSLFGAPTPALLLGLALLTAWISSINFGAFFHLASRATPSDSLATLIGFINFQANLGATLFTLMFGWLKDRTGSFSWAFAVLAILSLMAFLIGRIPLKKRFAND